MVLLIGGGSRRLLRRCPVVVDHLELRGVAWGHELHLLSVVSRVELHLVASRSKLLLALQDCGSHRHLRRLCLLLEVVLRLPVELRSVRAWRWQGLLLQGSLRDVVYFGAADPEIDLAWYMIHETLDP